MSTKNILIICPYPQGLAPSQRFRIEQYLSLLDEANISYTYESFLKDTNIWKIIFKKGNIFLKIIATGVGYLDRFWLLLRIRRYNLVYLHREASPLGPPIFEWIVTKIYRIPLIYDFDDSIWLPHTSNFNSLVKGLKWHSKVKKICKWATCVSVGNQYLYDFATNHNLNTIIIPTVVDTKIHKPIHRNNNKPITIGWTGSHSTIKYLNLIKDTLEDLSKVYSFELLVISDIVPDFTLPNMRYIPWQKTTEIEDLNRIDIGLMPLDDTPWEKGKCGFKAIQYMALSIPALVSPVGVNTQIVKHGYNGFHCSDKKEWFTYLEKLINNPQMRNDMGQAARQTIIENYSVEATWPILLSAITKYTEQ